MRIPSVVHSGMLGRDEMSGTPTAATSGAVKTTTVAQPMSTPSPTSTPTSTSTSTPSSGSWPSGDWILETVENINAAARARGIRAGGSAGPDPFDYDDDDDDDDADDEIEEIEAGGDDPLSTTAGPPPPPPPQRVAAGHMSRYQFRRMDGRPDDGRVNGTYVAVVESARPPRGVVYDPVSTSGGDGGGAPVELVRSISRMLVELKSCFFSTFRLNFLPRAIFSSTCTILGWTATCTVYSIL